MTPELLVILGFILSGTGALAVTRLSYWAGWLARDKWGRSSRYQAGEYSNGNCVPMPPAPPYRRVSNPFTSEFQQQINDCPGFTEGRIIRGNGTGGPTTPKPDIIPKPQPTGGRLIESSFFPFRYRPKSSRPGANPPPRNQ